MSVVDNFVREKILEYPILYPNRTAVLRHVFCVIGNGYEWTDEGTIDTNYPTDVTPWEETRALAEMEDKLAEYNPTVQEILHPVYMNDFEEERETVNHVEERMHLSPPITDPYPQSDFALLMTIPENVTDEWRAACDEIRVLAAASGWVL